MNCLINKQAGTARIDFNLADEQDRLTLIAWLKQLQPSDLADQFQIDKCIEAAGGTPEPGFPGYENMQQ